MHAYAKKRTKYIVDIWYTKRMIQFCDSVDFVLLAAHNNVSSRGESLFCDMRYQTPIATSNSNKVAGNKSDQEKQFIY